MRIVEQNNFHVVDKAVDAIDEVRQKSMSGDVDEEPFYICNISDIIQKHRIWQQRMPRVLPFYGKLIQTRNYFSPFTNISNSLNLTWKYAAKKNIFNVYLNHYSVQTGFFPRAIDLICSACGWKTLVTAWFTVSWYISFSEIRNWFKCLNNENHAFFLNRLSPEQMMNSKND